MSIGNLQREFAARALPIGLQIQCFGDGDVDAKLAIVAEAPGEQEVRMRMPLVGGSGKYLWDHLRRFGVTRRQCYITNVVKRQLASVKGKEQIPPNELAHWQGLVQWELSCLKNVKYVLVLGNVALEALSGRSGVDNWRGSVITVDGCSYVITNNPAHVMRTPSMEAWFLQDLSKLDMVMRGNWREHRIVPFIDPSPSEAIDYTRRMLDERKPVAFDIETTAGETACIGVANSPNEGMCINFRDAIGNRFTTADERDVRRSCQRLLGDSGTRLVAQNGNFDSYWLAYKDRISVHHVWFDTLLAHHLLYPSAPHDLGFIVTQYTTHPYYKDERVTWREKSDGKIEDFWVYNVKDCCLTLACSEKLHVELQREHLDQFFFNHVMRAQPHLTQMTVCGVRVDTKRKEEFDEHYAAHVDELEQKFISAVHTATGDPTLYPNPRSAPQMVDLLFRRLRLTGRGHSTAENNRKHVLAHPRTRPEDKDVILALAQYKKEHKFYSVYVSSRIDPDSRARTEYKQFGTQSAPGRLSSAQNMWHSGQNMQNQPPKAREMYIADEGYTFVYYDLSQAEARYVAWDANIPKWKQQFEQARKDGKYDCHRALASEMFKIPYADVPTKDFINEAYTIRYIAKRCRHGLNYRMGPDRLAEVTGLSYDEAVRAYNLYHLITPELRRWWSDLEATVRRERKLVTPFGRVWRLMERLEGDEQLEAIVAFKPQSTIGDKNTQVIYQCHDDDDWPLHARIMLNVHDSNTALCKFDDAKRVAAIMRKYAEKPIYIRGEEMIVPCELKWVPPTNEIRRWSDLVPMEL
jgi:uracil-DNA glycosylase family 4